MNQTIFSIVLVCFGLSIPRCASAQILTGNALGGDFSIYAATAGPYPSFGGSAFAKYEFNSLKKRLPKYAAAFPSIGAGVLIIGYGGGIIFPVEYNLGLDFMRLGLYTGVGAIINSEGGLLHPSFLPTIHGTTRLKFPKSGYFIDFEYRLFRHYHYSSLYSFYNPPFTRDGWTTATGIGLSIGRYLGRKSKKRQ